MASLAPLQSMRFHNYGGASRKWEATTSTYLCFEQDLWQDCSCCDLLGFLFPVVIADDVVKR